MIIYRILNKDHVNNLKQIDRSEHIDLIFEMRDESLKENVANHECPNWDNKLLEEIKSRFVYELTHDGYSIGAFEGEVLVGFGVLAHTFRGLDKDQLQVDLMYVSREYRRQGIGTRILELLGDEAKKRGAKHLYISSTETRSAVTFYKANGSIITSKIDQELYEKEPKDIHMIKEL